MRATCLFFTSTLLVACATTGKESSLIVSDPDWRYKKAFGTESFYYQCENEISIEVPKILITHETHWAGPIFPMLPVYSSKNYINSKLAVRLQIVGNIGGIRPQLEAVEFSLLTENGSFKGTSEFHAKDTWASINTVFPVEIGSLNNFSIIFIHLIPACKVSKIHYVKQEGSNNEFTLSPGP